MSFGNFGTDYTKVKVKAPATLTVKENADCIEEPLLKASAARERFGALNSPAFFDLGVDYRKTAKSKITVSPTVVERELGGTEIFQTIPSNTSGGPQIRKVQTVTTTRSRVKDGTENVQITKSHTVNGQTRQVQANVTVRSTPSPGGSPLSSPRRPTNLTPAAKDGTTISLDFSPIGSGPTITVLASEEHQTKNEVLPTLTVSTDYTPVQSRTKGQVSPRSLSPTSVSPRIQERIEQLHSPGQEKQTRPLSGEHKKGSPRNSKVICYGPSGAPTSPKGHAAHPNVKSFQAAKRRSLEAQWGESVSAQSDGKTTVSAHKMTASQTGTVSVTSLSSSSPRRGNSPQPPFVDSGSTSSRSKDRSPSPNIPRDQHESQSQQLSLIDSDNRSDADKVLSMRGCSPTYSNVEGRTSVVTEKRTQSHMQWQTVSSSSTGMVSVTSGKKGNSRPMPTPRKSVPTLLPSELSRAVMTTDQADPDWEDMDDEYDDVVVEGSQSATMVQMSAHSSSSSLLDSVRQNMAATDFGEAVYQSSDSITDARVVHATQTTTHQRSSRRMVTNKQRFLSNPTFPSQSELTLPPDSTYESVDDINVPPPDDDDDEYATDDSGYEPVSNQQPTEKSRWKTMASGSKQGRHGGRRSRGSRRHGGVQRGTSPQASKSDESMENFDPPIPPRHDHVRTPLRMSREPPPLPSDGTPFTSYRGGSPMGDISAVRTHKTMAKSSNIGFQHGVAFMESSSVAGSATMGFQRKSSTLPNNAGFQDVQTFSMSASKSSTQHFSATGDPTAINLLMDDWGGESSTDAPLPFKRTSFGAFQTEELYQVYHCNTVAFEALAKQTARLMGSDELPAIEAPKSPESPPIERKVCEPNQILTTYDKLKDISGEDSLDEIKKNLYSVIKSSAGYRTLWCEMPEVVQSGILGQMTDKDKRLQETLFEIITSEASYFRSIDVLIVNFLEDVTLNEVLQNQDKKDLFSNIQNIRDASQSFLKQMEEKWNEDFKLSCELCDIVREFCEKKFSSYVIYLAAQHLQERKLTELMASKSDFKNVLHRIQQRSECKKLPLQSFLSLPFQRITRLPLLMKSVMEQLDPQEKDHLKATEAFDVGRKLVEKCNSEAKQWQTIEEISRIEKSLDFKNCKRIAVTSKDRCLLKRGPLTRICQSTNLLGKKTEQCYLFVFNDIVIISKRKTKDKEERFEVFDHGTKKEVGVALMDEARVTERLKTSLPVKGAKNLLVVTMPGVPSVNYFFMSDSETDLTRWKESLTVEPVNDPKEKIYDELSCPRMEVLHRYTARDPDEIDLQESDILEVYRKMNDGWYEGLNTRSGKKGWFPSNYCLPIGDSQQPGRVVSEKYKMLSRARRQLPCTPETTS